MLSATNYLDIVRFCPLNSPLINFRSIKNMAGSFTTSLCKVFRHRNIDSVGVDLHCGLCRGKINSQRNGELILLDCFKLGWNFTFWQLASKLCKYVNKLIRNILPSSCLSVACGKPNKMIHCVLMHEIDLALCQQVTSFEVFLALLRSESCIVCLFVISHSPPH